MVAPYGSEVERWRRPPICAVRRDRDFLKSDLLLSGGLKASASALMLGVSNTCWRDGGANSTLISGGAICAA